MEDYTVKELHTHEVSSYRYEVIAPIDVDQEKDPLFLPLGKALIQTGALAQASDLTFQVINDQIYVIFRVVAPTNSWIYPRIRAAKDIFIATVNEAVSLKRVIEALELVEPKKRGK